MTSTITAARKLHHDVGTDIGDAIQQFRVELDGALKVLELGRALAPGRAGSVAQRIAGTKVLLGSLGAIPERLVAILDTQLDPASVALPADVRQLATMQTSVLDALPNAAAVLITRSPKLASWAIAQRPLPVRYFQMFGYTNADLIPVAAFDPAAIVEVIRANPRAPAVLLSDGSVLLWAKSLARAARLVLSLEEAAYVTALAERLGGARDYPAVVRETIYQGLQAHAR